METLLPSLTLVSLATRNSDTPLRPDWVTSPVTTLALLISLVLLGLLAGWLIRQQRRRPPGSKRWREVLGQTGGRLWFGYKRVGAP